MAKMIVNEQRNETLNNTRIYMIRLFTCVLIPPVPLWQRQKLYRLRVAVNPCETLLAVFYFPKDIDEMKTKTSCLYSDEVYINYYIQNLIMIRDFYVLLYLSYNTRSQTLSTLKNGKESDGK